MRYYISHSVCMSMLVYVVIYYPQSCNSYLKCTSSTLTKSWDQGNICGSLYGGRCFEMLLEICTRWYWEKPIQGGLSPSNILQSSPEKNRRSHLLGRVPFMAFYWEDIGEGLGSTEENPVL